MFEVLFGWRKASKCKKLIRRVQCRLKLLKSKRFCIVKHLRDDVAELLRHGHEQTAFERVEQLFKDESMVEVYDLLNYCCEFVVINLRYIRKHKTCPDDINEAVSTLVFASARFGNLPELLSVRKLFEERYGRKFVKAALELLPGNHVNFQVQENLYIKEVPEDVKYKLLNQIARNSVKSGPLLLEYEPILQEEKAKKSNSNQNLSMDVLQLQTEDFTPELQMISAVEAESMPFECDEMDKFTVSCDNHSDDLMTEDSSSESSAGLPAETIYLDDIEEFVSPATKDGTLQDQRLFVFKSFGTPSKERPYNRKASYVEGQILSQNKKVDSRTSRKTSRKRSRGRSLSQESRNVRDVECAIYYGKSEESFAENKHKPDHQRRRKTKNSMDESWRSYAAKGTEEHTYFVKMKSSFHLTKYGDRSSGFSNRCKFKEDAAMKGSLEHSCHFCGDEKDEWESRSKDLAMHGLEADKTKHGLKFSKYACKDEAKDDETDEEETQHGNLRVMSMPNNRPNESPSDNIFRSKSFPLEQRGNQHSSYRHIHPKLPDYDELAAKFMALKKANLQHKQQRQ